MSLRGLAHAALQSRALSSGPLATVVQRALAWRRRQRGRRQRAQRAEAIARHGTFGADDLLACLREAGIAEGGALFVQCSLNDMPTFEGKPGALLAMLDRLVGPTGTLLMPAYSTPEALGPDQVFDPAAAPTYTGITNEIFRRSPGVLRSLHPRHSICARGPMAESLLAGHELCAYADGPGSPFDRLRMVEGACILTLGLPPAFVSFLHWVEDVEPGRFPMPIHGARPVKRSVRRADGQVVDILDHELRDGIAGRMALSRVAQRLSPQAMRIIPFKGVTLGLYRVGPLADELIALRDQGIVHYR